MQGEAKEYLIRKDGYFYRPNCQGYTTRKIEAGRYTKAKAEAEAAVEPWHMSAVHQDDVPDEPAVADLNAEIARLQEQVETLRKERDRYRAYPLGEHAKVLLDALDRAEAAEAERDRLRKALVEISERPGRMTWGEDTEYRQAARDMEDIADAALQKEPQP